MARPSACTAWRSPRPTCWWCPGPWLWRRTSPSGRSSCWRHVRCWPFRSRWPSASTTSHGSPPSRRAVARGTAAVLPSVVLLVITLAGGGVTTYLPIERPEGYLATLVPPAVRLDRGGGTVAGGPVRRPGRYASPVARGRSSWGSPAWRRLSRGCGAGGRSFGGGGRRVRRGLRRLQNLTLVVAFARACGRGTSAVSAVWNAAFDAGTGIGAVMVGALAATGMGVPAALGACAGLIAGCLPLAVRASARPAADAAD